MAGALMDTLLNSLIIFLVSAIIAFAVVILSKQED